MVLTSMRVPAVHAAVPVADASAFVRDLWLEKRDRWQRIVVRLDHIPSGQDEVIVIIRGSDHLERAVLIAAEEFMWRSPYHDEACERHSENEVALYVHAHDAWDVLITESRATTGCSCTLVSLLTP